MLHEHGDITTFPSSDVNPLHSSNTSTHHCDSRYPHTNHDKHTHSLLAEEMEEASRGRCYQETHPPSIKQVPEESDETQLKECECDVTDMQSGDTDVKQLYTLPPSVSDVISERADGGGCSQPETVRNDLNKSASLQRKEGVRGDPRHSGRRENLASPNIGPESLIVSCDDNTVLKEDNTGLKVVTLTRGCDGFGFSFISGRPDGRPRCEHDRDFYITQVAYGSPAARCGRIDLNDSIIAIDDNNIRLWNYDRVIVLLRSRDKVTLKLRAFSADDYRQP